MGSINQKTLSTNYRLLDIAGGAGPSFRDVGFRVFSEFDEDGILLYLFSIIPPRTFKCVEMCAGDGMECNTTNLILHHRWVGLLFDANKEYVRVGTDFFRRNPETRIWPPKFAHAWIKAANVNSLLIDNGMEGEVDLLSLDMDGVDYWIWKSMKAIQPRVVVLEANPTIPSNLSITVPYNPEFEVGNNRNYFGASLSAFVKLGHLKGYHLVGTNWIGTNAFFIRSDIKHPWLPEVTVESCLKHPRIVHAREHRWPTVKNKNWEKV